ncbi:MAG: hypothetical protein JEZ08_04520 [Clostridiales bacterium]|nr:hypothetical protein [Clostridiales bacterium]
MIVCKICGFENYDVAEICNKCNCNLKEQVGESFNKENKVENNKIASFIKALSIVILGFGLFAAVIVPAGTSTNYGSFDFGAMVTMIFSALLAFAGLRGFAEIIEKLHRSEIHQKGIHELLKGQNATDKASNKT